MPIEIKVPDLGEGIDSADVIELLVREGDTISADQDIVEVETDKATAPIPSPQAGRVASIAVKKGDTVSVGATLLTLEAAEQEDSQKSDAPEEDGDAQKTEPAEEAETEIEEKGQEKSESSEEVSTETAEEPSEEKTPSTAASAAEAEPPRPARSKSTREVAREVAAEFADDNGSGAVSAPAGPAVRRFAREVGVDLKRVVGSGPGGRITREDILSQVRERNRAPARPAPTHEEAKADEPPAAGGPQGETDEDKWGTIIRAKLTRIRATIAKNMAASHSTIPHVTNFDDADITELERIRQSSKADYAKSGVKLTTLPFVIKAVAEALEEHPAVNASIDLEAGHIIYKQYVNIGIAVDTERGLMVPVIREANRLGIPQIAQELAGVAEKARTNSITIDDMRGGTFTISNLGAIGGTYSTPIINSPEVAILLVGRSREMPVILNGETVPRLMMPLSLSYDHRLVDGAAAARFLNDVKTYLQSPGRLLLAP